MDDETPSAHLRAPQPAPGQVGSEEMAALLPADEFSPGGRGLRNRATAGAAALGATALLVLSFGPTALALSPSDMEGGDTPQGDRVSVAPLPAGSAVVATPPRAEDENTRG